MEEREYKWLLKKEAYERLREVVRSAGFGVTAHSVQINYYYDTNRFYYSRRGTTVRIRQKGGRLTGTVKHHMQSTDGLSQETPFPVSTLPGRIHFSGRTLPLQGQLATERSETLLSSGIVLCLDRNQYLGREDYELELEYPGEHAAAVGEWAAALSKLIGSAHGEEKAADFNRISKSERFFIEKKSILRRKAAAKERSTAYELVISS